MRIYRGASPATALLRLSLEAMSRGLISSGEVMPEDVEWALAELDDPDSVFLTPLSPGGTESRRKHRNDIPTPLAAPHVVAEPLPPAVVPAT